MPRILSCAAVLSCLALGSIGLGCATARDPDSPTDDLTESEEAAATAKICERTSTVAVRVHNESSVDVGIAFGHYRPGRPVLGFTETTFHVPRATLEGYSIRLWIEHGGLETGNPPPVPTEPVWCNDATLIIAGGVRYAFFYGDEFPIRKPNNSE